MTGTTISQSYVNGVTLTNAGSYNPVSILAGVTIAIAAGPAIQASGTIDWTISNAGTALGGGTSAGSYGIAMQGGGTVTNLAGGMLGGAYGGVAMHGIGTVLNAGSIASTVATAGAAVVLAGGGYVENQSGGVITGYDTGIALQEAGSVTNAGTLRGLTGSGALLAGGGAVSNGTASSILGYSTGVSLGGVGTVVNQGSIGAGQTAGAGYTYSTVTQATTLLAGGVLLDSGGVSNAAGGIISSYFFGIAASGAASVDNSGLITASSTTIGIGAFLLDGGSLDNAASGTIDGQFDAVLIDGTTAATVINQGSITAAYRAGVDLFGTGSYGSNAASGTITGYLGVLLRATGQVVNAGSIGGTRYGVDLVGIGTVINDAAARISATAGVLELAGGTVDNLGIIVGSGTSAKGVYQYAGGYLSNASTGTIDSEGSGVLFTKDAGTVMNLGNIASTDVGAGAGVWLRDGGTVTNVSGADISAKFIGVQVGYVTTSVGGTVVNAGSIVAVDGTVGAGVWLHGPGAISNASSGTIYGGLDGVVIYDQTTLTNAGSIGGQQYAVHAAAGFADRLIVAPGAIFSGLVSGGNALTATIASVLELAAGSAAGTISGFDSKYLGFQEIAIDAGAAWSLGGTVAASQTVSFGGPDTTLTLANPGSMAGEIIGFSAHDTIVLAGVTGVSAATLNLANQLTVAGPDLTFQFDPKQTFAGTDFGFVQVGDHTDLTVPCFAAGTHIGTPSGEAAVEQLRVGDRVLTRRGERLAVAWLGHRRTDCRRHPRPWEVWPVRVRASAFGAGMPHRDLLLSPDHAVCIDNVLIPIRYLINDATILQERVDSVTYWHVELDRHEVLLAEGMPCESYLDTGNRGAFANGGMALAAAFERA